LPRIVGYGLVGMESADEVGVLSGASYEPLALRSHRCVSVMHCIRDVTTCIGDISISDGIRP